MLPNLSSLLGVATAGAAIALFSAGAATSVFSQTPAPDDGISRPTVPAQYAEAAFNAWLQGDEGTLTDLVTVPPADLLLARDPGTDVWDGPPLCEGAAGSTYCTWASDSSQLLLRVANEVASQGQPNAVTEASFIPTVDGVAIWPFSTQEQADNTQASVDQGHSPWMLDPIAVGDAYASAVLGWEDAVVEMIDPAVLRLRHPVVHVMIDVTIAQPARQGEGGIWAIVRTLPPAGEPAPPAPTWDETAVWQPSSVDFADWERICGESPAMMDPPEGIECGLKVMQQVGAAPAAQDFLRQSGYFLESFEELGPIDYGRGSAPWANMGRPAQQLFLNGSPPLVEASFDALETWRQDPSYAEIAAMDQYAGPWTEYGMLLSSNLQPEPGISQTIWLTFPLQSCRACAPFGFAGVRYTFDLSGQLIAQSMLPMDQSQPR
ncbi:MAG: hypothetical protein GEU28_13005 [Dehalococcoidia bacterium]|nr:hypothetical protein [Dehalococcoidia bacterium]